MSTQESVQQKKQPRDWFRGLRKSYNSIIKAFASNNIVALTICGIPFYYMCGYGIFYSRYTSSIGMLLSAVWTFMSIFLLTWVTAAVAVWKVMPNLLTSSIFIYTAIGHWCLISLFVILCYLSSYIPMGYAGSLLSAIMPPILFLLICGDILRAVRTRLYLLVEQANTIQPSNTAIAPVDTATIQPANTP
jgi:hypothetical protein